MLLVSFKSSTSAKIADLCLTNSRSGRNVRVMVSTESLVAIPICTVPIG